ncbi:MAG TPA: phosphoglycerate kinase [Solirubrobacteraceae bacterium]|jgi:phosphoglycerate kinase|nr:phosphoglycerate kinase [Solirubrobacteraceae bacterium]
MRSIEDLEVQGKRVLVRVDFNVPLGKDESGAVCVADDTRIVQALPTIQELRERGARLVLVSHLGRPEGRPEADLSLAPVAERLRELTGAPVTLSPEVVGERSRVLAEGLADGEMLLLENVRFEPGETAGDPDFARALASLAELYVNDAFGAAHRAHASTTLVARLLPCAAGRLLEREVRTLTGILEHPTPPLAAIVGGAKVADKIGVIERFLQIADVVMIGGAMCFPFLCAQGHSVGRSLCGEQDTEHARSLLARASDTHAPQPGRARLLVPSDLVIGDRLAAEAKHRVLDGVEVPDGWMGLDIGPATSDRYGAEIAKAGTVFWNGPMGAFELEPFAQGTLAVARAVAKAPGVTVVGGGDSAAALAHFGLEDTVDHLSTGGGATLEMIEARPPAMLPGVQALEGAAKGHATSVAG